MNTRTAWSILLLCILLHCSYASSKFNGTFMYPATIPQAQLSAYFNEIQGLGMDTIVIQFTRQVQVCGDPSSYYWSTPLSYTSALLSLASTQHVNVYIGLALTFDPCSVFYNQQNTQATGTDTSYAVSSILALGSFSSLKGWYIPDEPAIVGWDQPSLTYSYYQTVVNAIRTYSTLPILVSPYLVGVSATKTPQYAASQALAFQTNTGINIQVWQDSVGAAAINIYNRAGQPTLRDYFSNISAAIGKSNMWSDLEAYNYGVDLNAVSGGYRACSGVRLANQLQSTSAYVSSALTWIQQVHFGTIDQVIRKPEALRLFNEYRSDLFSSSSLSYLSPLSYKWDTPPSASYPDTATPSKLFNKITGDPLSFTDPQWVGILGNAEAVLDFGKQVTVLWIGAHVLTDTSSGIVFPQTLQLYASNSTTSWNSLSSFPLPFTTSLNGEYVFGNTDILPSISYRYLKINMTNIQWTFVSEVECVGK